MPFSCWASTTTEPGLGGFCALRAGRRAACATLPATLPTCWKTASASSFLRAGRGRWGREVGRAIPFFAAYRHTYMGALPCALHSDREDELPTTYIYVHSFCRLFFFYKFWAWGRYSFSSSVQWSMNEEFVLRFFYYKHADAVAGRGRWASRRYLPAYLQHTTGRTGTGIWATRATTTCTPELPPLYKERNRRACRAGEEF